MSEMWNWGDKLGSRENGGSESGWEEHRAGGEGSEEHSAREEESGLLRRIEEWWTGVKRDDGEFDE